MNRNNYKRKNKVNPEIEDCLSIELGKRKSGDTPKGDKPKGTNCAKCRFLHIFTHFADSRLWQENKAFGKRRFLQKAADRMQEPAENRRLAFVPLSAALENEKKSLGNIVLHVWYRLSAWHYREKDDFRIKKPSPSEKRITPKNRTYRFFLVLFPGPGGFQHRCYTRVYNT